LNGSAASVIARGGLTGLQQKKVADFIEENLARDVKLSELAAVAELSSYHFARAFKQSFGVPPHRYHVGRRIERAKEILSSRSVTEVALAVGFAETSSFSAAFRKMTGRTPTEFRRGIA
jgi:AraC family transcriptional regulator